MPINSDAMKENSHLDLWQNVVMITKWYLQPETQPSLFTVKYY